MSTTTTQTPAGAAMDELMSRVHFSGSWGFYYLACPHCGSTELLSVMREAYRTHRPWTTCDGCGARLGYAHDIDQAIRKQMIALGAPLQTRPAKAVAA